MRLPRHSQKLKVSRFRSWRNHPYWSRPYSMMEVKWCWGDDALLNPWSSVETLMDTIERLAKCRQSDEHRPVEVWVHRTDRSLRFANVGQALNALRLHSREVPTDAFTPAQYLRALRLQSGASRPDSADFTQTRCSNGPTGDSRQYAAVGMHRTGGNGERTLTTIDAV